jgi:hypothetical protein
LRTLFKAADNAEIVVTTRRQTKLANFSSRLREGARITILFVEFSDCQNRWLIERGPKALIALARIFLLGKNPFLIVRWQIQHFRKRANR